MHTMDFVAVFVMLCIFSFGTNNGLAAIFDVVNYGAVGDGRTDDTHAFLKAWGAVCQDGEESPTMIIPVGKSFLLKPVKFQGPCNATNVHIQVLGTIVAPKDISAWTGCEVDSWLLFWSVDGLNIDGSGQIDGQGSSWWMKNKNAKKRACNKPTALYFEKCNGMRLSGLNHLNSPRNHIGIHNCSDVIIRDLHIMAPQNSPNTDGIDISSSTNVNIRDCHIGTGDDCVAINSGSSNINITGVTCGPGHGISVGSLGQKGSFAKVEDVHVQDCNFTGTQNGVRIKTWQGGSGYAKHINFEQIRLENVQNPIIIDQYYCDGKHNCPKKRSAVEVSDVTYKYVQGTSASKIAINLKCSQHKNCTKIVMDHINITPFTSGGSISVSCNNANGTSSFTSPNVPCLLSQ